MGQKEIVIRAAEKNSGKKLSELLQEQQISVDMPCGGRGSCGKCRVQFLEGAPALTQQEKKVLTAEEQKKGIRLACQTIPQKDCRVLVSDSGIDDMVVIDKGSTAVEKQETGSATFQRTAGMPGGKKQRYGFAVDLGTTTLVMALYELSTGIRLGVKTSVNHQRAYGADVLSRIHAANQGRAGQLQKTIVNDLRRLAISFLPQYHVMPGQIERMVIAGNTTMCHLLLGYSTEHLGQAPFLPVDISWTSRSYQELFQSRELSAEVIILPGISAFVGADIVAGIYASGMLEQKENSLFLDVGTNGEMAFGGPDGILVTSTAAGPVFEGGGIKNGMPGVPGAVSHVTLNGQGEIAGMETIGGKAAAGLCGSGIVDFVSELVRHGFVDENGTLREPWFSEGIPLQKPEIRLYQEDIREFQMGKAAIRAGIEVLRKKKKRDSSETVYLAGGFGYGLCVESAMITGMFPPDFAGRVKVLGNSALEGAARCLLKGDRKEIEKIVSLAENINLAEDAGFYDSYVEAMQFVV